jgi:hypothetical protein
MSSSSRPTLDDLPRSEALRVEQACNRFEAAWRAGAAPRLGDFLEGWEGPGREVLLRELVLLDLDFRRARGESCSVESYLLRFPTLDAASLVRQAAPAGSCPEAGESLAGKTKDSAQAGEPEVAPARPADGGASLAELLARVAGLGRGERLAALRLDQFRRWQSGERVLAEAYFAQLPVLCADEEAALDLIYCEMMLCEQYGQAASLDHYVRRFPQYRARLERHFEIHQALALVGPTVLDPPATPEEAGATPPSIAVPAGTVGPAEQRYEVLRSHVKGGLG